MLHHTIIRGGGYRTRKSLKDCMSESNQTSYKCSMVILPFQLVVLLSKKKVFTVQLYLVKR